MKRIALILGTILAAICLLWYVFAPSFSWSGAAPAKIKVTVTDSVTLAPVAGAAVELRHSRADESHSTMSPEYYDKLIHSAVTDGIGTAAWLSVFGAGGSGGIFGRTGIVRYTDVWLQVTAGGYVAVRVPLSGFTGETRSIKKSQETAITIRLTAIPPTP